VKLAILHHHFEPGGVTQVVRGHLIGLADLPAAERPRAIALLHGGRSSGLHRADLEEMRATIPITELTLPGLDYDRVLMASGMSDAAAPDRLAAEIDKALRGVAFDPDQTVLHVHNPALGKNARLPETLRRLGRRGWRLLMQIHDFAEDLRPNNWRALVNASGKQNAADLATWLYPQSPTVHYATLVRRDRDFLAGRSIDPRRLYVIPNPIIPAAEGQKTREEARREIDRTLGIDPASRYLLYPVRGIQRKNLGEILLLSLLCRDPTTFSITLAPKTPLERHSWTRWQHWARDLDLSVNFGSGSTDGISLETNRAAADSMVSTSVAEGFGMVFLESWLADRAIVGRDLPGVTKDFETAGLCFDNLYHQISIPLDSRHLRAARHQRQLAWERTWMSIPPDLRPACEALPCVDDDKIDFGDLTPDWQCRVIHRLKYDRGFNQLCYDCNREALNRVESKPATTLIDNNKKVVAQRYAPRVIAQQLREIYQRILSDGASGSLDSHPPQGSSDRAAETQAGIAFRPLRIETEVRSFPLLRLARPLEPIPTDHPPQLNPIPNIRAVIFDIYGTLIISGSGDVGSADSQPRSEALRLALTTLDLAPAISADAGIKRLHQIIQQHQVVARGRGIDYPEVDIVDVWRNWLIEYNLDPGFAVQVAEQFEARANPCWAMPKAADLIQRLASRDLALGIVSNAQFFTEPVFTSVLGDSFADFGFDLDLCLMSYRYGHGKPGARLFDRLAVALKRRGISPGQAVYVGNDFLNDVTAASRAGLKTVLFAGDRRSLRLRDNDPRCAGVKADAVVTDLNQVFNIL
jgi:FMN phosphatase YigB (HAD superfamily)